MLPEVALNRPLEDPKCLKLMIVESVAQVIWWRIQDRKVLGLSPYTLLNFKVVKFWKRSFDLIQTTNLHLYLFLLPLCVLVPGLGSSQHHHAGLWEGFLFQSRAADIVYF